MQDIDRFTLKDGYSRRKNPPVETFRPLTPDEARALHPGVSVIFTGDYRTYRLCRVNGAVKTWKRDPARVELPIAYGMYERARAEARGDRMVLPNGGCLLVTAPAKPTSR